MTAVLAPFASHQPLSPLRDVTNSPIADTGRSQQRGPASQVRNKLKKPNVSYKEQKKAALALFGLISRPLAADQGQWQSAQHDGGERVRCTVLHLQGWRSGSTLVLAADHELEEEVATCR